MLPKSKEYRGGDPLAPFRNGAFADLMTIKKAEDLAAAMNTHWESTTRDTSRLTTALWIGAAWRFGEATKLIEKGKGRADEFAKLLNYSAVHARVCARLFDDRDIMNDAAAWYLDNQPKITMRPRKGEGIEWQVAVNKAYKLYSKALDETGSEDDAYTKVNDDLAPKVPEDRPKRLSAKIIEKRWQTFLSEAMARLATTDRGQDLVHWNTPADMIAWIETSPVRPNEERDYEDLIANQEVPFRRAPTPTAPKKRRGRPRKANAEVLQLSGSKRSGSKLTTQRGSGKGSRKAA
jgi:hypothetical protein